MPSPVLVVEDDPSTRTLFVTVLQRDGLQCDCAADGAEAIAKLRRERYCAVVLDLLLPHVNGFEVLQFIRAERSDTLRRVIVTTSADVATLQHFDARDIGALLLKPVDIEEFAAIVRACADDHANQN